MREADFVVGQTYPANAIANEAFARLDDGTAVYVSRLASTPVHHRILASDQIGYRGEIPEWVGEVFHREERFLLFVERAPDCVECVGLVMACTFRSAQGKPFEIAFHVPDLSREIVAALAPDVLEQVEARPWSATAYIEVVRSGDEWIARALDHEVSHRARELLVALADVADELGALLLRNAKPGERLAAAMPDTSGMRALGQNLGEAAIARRVIVRVGYYSADLDIPGWAVSRDDSWAD